MTHPGNPSILLSSLSSPPPSYTTLRYSLFFFGGEFLAYCALSSSSSSSFPLRRRPTLRQTGGGLWTRRRGEKRSPGGVGVDTGRGLPEGCETSWHYLPQLILPFLKLKIFELCLFSRRKNAPGYFFFQIICSKRHYKKEGIYKKNSLGTACVHFYLFAVFA